MDMVQDKGPLEGSCEHGIEPSGSIKCWEVLEGLHNYAYCTRKYVTKFCKVSKKVGYKLK
jgi:hypothetical protein